MEGETVGEAEQAEQTEETTETTTRIKVRTPSSSTFQPQHSGLPPFFTFVAVAPSPQVFGTAGVPTQAQGGGLFAGGVGGKAFHLQPGWKGRRT